MDAYKLPIYVRITIFLIGLFAFVTMLYFARVFLVPVIIATLISIMLNPVVTYLVKKKVRRGLAVLLTMVPALVLAGVLATMFLSQANQFTNALPKLLDKLHTLVDQSVQWSSHHFSMNPKNIEQWVTKTESQFMNKAGMLIGHTISALGDVLIMVVFMPVYIFMILYYKPLLIEFIYKIFGIQNTDKVNEILTATKVVIQSYLIGLVIEAGIVALLYSIGLMIVGIEYAILLGIVAALLNIIPYLGAIIAASTFMLIAFITKESITSVFLVLLVYFIIHAFDNFFIIPRIVASKVRLNALVTITAIFAGSALWGIPGMFLSIPVSAIAKIIFDRINSLEPWGHLMGDSMPAEMK